MCITAWSSDLPSAGTPMSFSQLLAIFMSASVLEKKNTKNYNYKNTFTTKQIHIFKIF